MTAHQCAAAERDRWKARLRGARCQWLGARNRQELRDPEVRHTHPSVAAKKNVVWLEVAMHEPFGMRRRKASACREEDVQHFLPASRPLTQPAGDAPAFRDLHRHEHLILELTHVVDAEHVGMREEGHGSALAQDASAQLLRRHAGQAARPQHLECDLAIELRIVRRVHHPHAACSDGREDFVAADLWLAAGWERLVAACRLGRDCGGRHRDQFAACLALREVLLNTLEGLGRKPPLDELEERFFRGTAHRHDKPPFVARAAELL